MWFLLNPPGKATIQIQSIDNFEWLSTKYNTTLKKQSAGDPRYISELNQLRFYLPDVFPALDKIVLFDHDVVVQRDLTGLWRINMKGKVNGAVETCHENEALSRRMDLLINFSDPLVAKRFDVNACTWAFGMNFFDLQEWRRQNLTDVYHKYLQLVNVLFVLAFACVLICCGLKFSLFSIRNISTNAVFLKDVYFCSLLILFMEVPDQLLLSSLLLRFFLWPLCV
jgi:hypothetical protein